MTSETPERLRVDLGQRGYDILVGAGLLQAAASHIKAFAKRPRLFVVTDEVVAALHLKTLQGALEAGGYQVHAFILPAGEATKSFAQLSQLCSQLLAKGMERSDLLIALGGGVIGDLTGFAAAILLRGLDFVQIPTTLLAQVDSSVGGKTAIDVPEGKNLVGAFHQPRLVLADGDVLATLPKRELLAGYAEVVKYGLIDKPDFFTWLEKNGEKLVAGDSALRRQAVVTSCRAKAEIVARDETESGDRALLNLGHTFGHALETLLGYDEQLKHGEAVAIGMCQAFRFSHRLGLLGKEDAERLERHIAAVGLKTRVKEIEGFAPTPAALMAAMARDKKVKDGRITFILARGIGRAFIERGIEPAVLEEFLKDDVG